MLDVDAFHLFGIIVENIGKHVELVVFIVFKLFLDFLNLIVYVDIYFDERY